MDLRWYESEAINKYLETSTVSPVTGKTLICSVTGNPLLLPLDEVERIEEALVKIRNEYRNIQSLRTSSSGSNPSDEESSSARFTQLDDDGISARLSDSN